MIKIGERIEVVEHGDGWPRITQVKLDGKIVGAIQQLSICFDAYKPNAKLLKILDFGDSEARALQFDFAAEMVRCGFDVQWATIDDMPKVEAEVRTEKLRANRVRGRWKPRRGYPV